MTKVANAIKFAQSDKDILNENSTFCQEAKTEFEGRLIEWNTDDQDQNNVPTAVFKIVLHGYGYMGYLDHKDICEPKEVFLTLNSIFTALGIKEINNNDIATVEGQIDKIDDSGEKARVLIKEMEKHVHGAGHEISWFDENGGSYAFFIVLPETAKKLENVALDENHKFISRPVF